jgi:hypothetical protein
LCIGYLPRNWRVVAAASSLSVLYHDGSSLIDSGMIERLELGDKVSDEGSLDMELGECKGSVGWSCVVEWSGGRELVGGERGPASVLDRLTGLREKRDFLEVLAFCEGGSMPKGD